MLTDSLRPRGEIDPAERTKGKDEAYTQLEELRENGEFHGRSVADLADELGWSGPHIRSVLKIYYEDTGDDGEEPEPEPEPEREPVSVEEAEPKPTANETCKVNGVTLEITIPEGVDQESFIRGYLEGLLG